MRHRGARSLRATALAFIITAALAGQVAATVNEWGTKSCPTSTGWLRAYWYDWLVYRAPGGTLNSITPYDGAWHISTRSGAYGGGDWSAGAANLNLPGTYAYCQGT